MLALGPRPAEGEWRAIGPYGGDVRSLAADPSQFSRLFLGTSNSQIYASADGGRHWAHLSELSPHHDLVVDHLLVDPRNPALLYAATWSTNRGGGVFRSVDGGRTWTILRGMSGRSVRALVMAAGDPAHLVAGTLEGVFRSTDAGATWKRISPENHPEIRNVESLALDPDDPASIYAGTWHLPWKTTDGGNSWFSIKTGIIDDSDVFSMAVDWSNRQALFLSACSGIYHTATGGRLWRKIHGIPSTARRTRVIRQDPTNAPVVFAGTTEGLWKTDSGGAAWRRLTADDMTVNDILIDPSNTKHLFLATDRAGVLESRDGGEIFQASHEGFSHRQVSRLFFDAQSGQMLAAVLHDKEYGGVFAAPGEAPKDNTGLGDGPTITRGSNTDEGAAAAAPSQSSQWRQWSLGLEGRDVLTLARVPRGDLLAGTADGLFRFNAARQAWERTGQISKPGRNIQAGAFCRDCSAIPLTLAVNYIWPAASALYAATSQGVLRSTDGGQTWVFISPLWRVDYVAASRTPLPEGMLVAATSRGISVSLDGGRHWLSGSLPERAEPANALALARETIYVATERGLFWSSNAGATWKRQGRGLPYGPVGDVLVDPADPKRIYVASLLTHTVYYSTDGGQSYQALDREGFVGRAPRRLALAEDGRLLVASGYDGAFVRKVAQP